MEYDIMNLNSSFSFYDVLKDIMHNLDSMFEIPIVPADGSCQFETMVVCLERSFSINTDQNQKKITAKDVFSTLCKRVYKTFKEINYDVIYEQSQFFKPNVPYFTYGDEYTIYEAVNEFKTNFVVFNVGNSLSIKDISMNQMPDVADYDNTIYLILHREHFRPLVCPNTYSFNSIYKGRWIYYFHRLVTIVALTNESFKEYSLSAAIRKTLEYYGFFDWLVQTMKIHEKNWTISNKRKSEVIYLDDDDKNPMKKKKSIQSNISNSENESPDDKPHRGSASAYFRNKVNNLAMNHVPVNDENMKMSFEKFKNHFIMPHKITK